jgi:hypothetical protein
VHPFKVFDALFGLTAIALGNPELARSIAGEIRLLRGLAGGVSSSTVVQIYDDALDLVEGTADWAGNDAGEIEALGWKAGSSAGLATKAALRTDPAIVTQSGHLLGFIILPVALATPVARFNPARRIAPGARQSTPTGAIEEVVRAAWGASPPVPPRVLH